MIRFSENQPWNFGIKPSEHFEQLSGKQKKVITLDYLSWKSIDNLFDYINDNCPDARYINENNREVMRDGVDPCFAKTMYPYQSALAVTYCKPTTWFPAHKTISPEQEIILNKMNIKIKKRYTKDGNPSPIIGFSEEILNEFSQIIINTKHEEFHLAVGILLGYPLGNVFGCVLNFKTFKKYKNITHLIYDTEWTREWRDKVGWKGEKHLGRVYKKYLNLK